jgi:hypothetical protein
MKIPNNYINVVRKEERLVGTKQEEVVMMDEPVDVVCLVQLMLG